MSVALHSRNFILSLILAPFTCWLTWHIFLFWEIAWHIEAVHRMLQGGNYCVPPVTVCGLDYTPLSEGLEMIFDDGMSF